MHMRRAWSFFIAALTLSAPTAHAAVHEWDVKEVFSNETGSIQYIELFTSSPGQTLIGGHDLIVTAGGTTRRFTIPANLPGGTSTAGAHLLFATPEFAALGIVTPDYILPCGAFFDPTASSITVAFDTYDSITFTGAELPEDGVRSIEDLTAATLTTTLAAGAASPRNLAGDDGVVMLSACHTDGSCSGCDDGLYCNGGGSCMGSACVATEEPCAMGLICDEASDTCQCDSPDDCNDGNPCTDDSCPTVTCVHTNNTAACDDGMFCTMTDACSGGSCVGTGDTCAGEQCIEATDLCGACTMDADCDDGMFCNGGETCAAGACVMGTAPCDASESCDEDTDACAPLCGDGALLEAEECDDGNDADGDGCDASCMIEGGFTCDVDVEPTVCTRVEVDAGPIDADAGMGADAGMTTEEGGCGCRSTSSHGGAWWALLGIAAFAARRRRR